MSADHQRFLLLGWEILEHKWRYYIGVAYGVEPISDAEYDKLEQEYITLAAKLNQTEYSNVVGFPLQRASGKLVDERMRKKYNINVKMTFGV